MKSSKWGVASFFLMALGSQLVQGEPLAAKGQVKILGVWEDPMLRCSISIEEKAGRYTEVSRDCKDWGGVLTKPLVKTGVNSFRINSSPRKPWHYVIGASSDLEVWDSDGPVRTLRATVAKTDAQLLEQKKTEAAIVTLDKKIQGVSVGMSVAEVLGSSWGKPSKINRTSTANGVHEQWVYKGGYLYLQNGRVTAVQN